MTGDPTEDGNQAHGSDVFLDSVFDGIDRLQEDGGVAPEMAHRPSNDLSPPRPSAKNRRTGQWM